MQFLTEQERIDSMTMRMERTDIKGSGYIQFPPQKPFQQPLESQPPTIAHQAHPELYQSPAPRPASRPAYPQGVGGVRPQPSAGPRPSGYQPPSYVPAPSTQGGYRPPASPYPSVPRDAVRPSNNVRPAHVGTSYQPRPSAGAYRPPQPAANGHARPSYSAAPASYPAKSQPQQGPRPYAANGTYANSGGGGNARGPAAAAPGAYTPNVPRPAAPRPQPMRPQAVRPQAAVARAPAPMEQPPAPARPVVAPEAVRAPVPAPESSNGGNDGAGGLSKSQLKRLRKKMREGV